VGLPWPTGLPGGWAALFLLLWHSFCYFAIDVLLNHVVSDVFA
jgi:hypothetical protein